MERKIGETFEYKGKIFKVTEAKGDICIGCFFNGRCFASDVAGECESEYRSDKKEVIFVEIQEQPHVQAEQPKELNLCEILKDCPQGETFWSPMLGDVIFYDINQSEGIVRVKMENGKILAIKTDGTITICGITSPEIMLFPSSEQRNWAKVKYEPKKEKFDPKTLKSFDRVITRNEYDEWTCALFSHIGNKPNTRFIYVTCESVYEYCIPYNDDTKHLVGTKDEAPVFYRYWED